MSEIQLTKNCIFSTDNSNRQSFLLIGNPESEQIHQLIGSDLLKKSYSYVVADYEGKLLNKFSSFLRETTPTYQIMKLDFINPSSSLIYNPFYYLISEEDVLTFADALIDNYHNRKFEENFLLRCARDLIISYVYYLLEARPKTDWKLSNLPFLHNQSQGAHFTSKPNEEYVTVYEILLESLVGDYPNSKAFSYFQKVNLYKYTDLYRRVIIVVSDILSPLEFTTVKTLTTGEDTMHLQDIVNDKTALFIVISKTAPYLDFLAALLYSQLFKIIHSKEGADVEHVRFFMNDFTNYKLPNFDRIISLTPAKSASFIMTVTSKRILDSIYGDAISYEIKNCCHRILSFEDDKAIMTILSPVSRKEDDDLVLCKDQLRFQEFLSCEQEINIQKLFSQNPDYYSIRDTKPDIGYCTRDFDEMIYESELVFGNAYKPEQP